MNHHNHRESRIENPTLAHFRHLRHFRHSVPRSFPTDCTILKGVRIITYFQTHSFLTNKANFGKAQMNVIVYYIKDYQNFIPLAGYKNKPNSNPIKACPERSRMGQFTKGQNRLPKNPATPIPALLKVFDGSINFDIIASRYKNIQSKINIEQLLPPVNTIR